MRVALYAPDSHQQAANLRSIIERLPLSQGWRRCRSILQLKQELMNPWKENSLFLLAPVNQQDLDNLLTIREWLSEERVIVVLPDRKENTIHTGHKLFPRFLTYGGSTFSGLSAVLSKMALGSQDT